MEGKVIWINQNLNLVCPQESKWQANLRSGAKQARNHWLAQSWWRHQMETFSALLAICAGNSPVPSEFPAQRPVPRSFDIFFDLLLNKRSSKQWWGWWFETPSRPWWRHYNDEDKVHWCMHHQARLSQWHICIGYLHSQTPIFGNHYHYHHFNELIRTGIPCVTNRSTGHTWTDDYSSGDFMKWYLDGWPDRIVFGSTDHICKTVPSGLPKLFSTLHTWNTVTHCSYGSTDHTTAKLPENVTRTRF